MLYRVKTLYLTSHLRKLETIMPLKKKLEELLHQDCPRISVVFDSRENHVEVYKYYIKYKYFDISKKISKSSSNDLYILSIMTRNLTKYRRVAGEDDSPGGERARVPCVRGL